LILKKSVIFKKCAGSRSKPVITGIFVLKKKMYIFALACSASCWTSNRGQLPNGKQVRPLLAGPTCLFLYIRRKSDGIPLKSGKQDLSLLQEHSLPLFYFIDLVTTRKLFPGERQDVSSSYRRQSKKRSGKTSRSE